MKLISHRRNTIDELINTPIGNGVEVDIRSLGNELIVVHDPFTDVRLRLEDWLAHFRHDFLVANVKEEGLEPRLIPLLQSFGIVNFFILDESFPFIRKFARNGLSQFAVRVSEFEDYHTALDLQRSLQAEGRKVDWVWADSFSGSPLSGDIYAALRKAGLKVCLVSPELHHVEDPASWHKRIAQFQDELSKISQGFTADAVCTKLPEAWGVQQNIGAYLP